MRIDQTAHGGEPRGLRRIHLNSVPRSIVGRPFSPYNGNNHFEYEPWEPDGSGARLLVLEEWWARQPPAFREAAANSLAPAAILPVPRLPSGDLPRPPRPALASGEGDAAEHPEQGDDARPRLAWDMYHVVCHAYNFDFWYPSVAHLLPHVRVIPLGPASLEAVREVFKRRNEGRDARGFTDEDAERTAAVMRELTLAMKSLCGRVDGRIDREFFVRMSKGSSKHDTPLRPVGSAAEAMEMLTGSRRLYDGIVPRATLAGHEWPVSVILAAWDDRITPRNEFRVFVRGRRVTAIAQQKWYEVVNLSDEEVRTAARSIAAAPYWAALNHQDTVADVWVDLATGACTLIECNPFGAHAASGSSLYRWVEDYDVLYGSEDDDVVDFRQLCACAGKGGYSRMLDAE